MPSRSAAYARADDAAATTSHASAAARPSGVCARHAGRAEVRPARRRRASARRSPPPRAAATLARAAPFGSPQLAGPGQPPTPRHARPRPSRFHGHPQATQAAPAARQAAHRRQPALRPADHRVAQQQRRPEHRQMQRDDRRGAMPLGTTPRHHQRQRHHRQHHPRRRAGSATAAGGAMRPRPGRQRAVEESARQRLPATLPSTSGCSQARARLLAAVRQWRDGTDSARRLPGSPSATAAAAAPRPAATIGGTGAGGLGQAQRAHDARSLGRQCGPSDER